MLTSSRTVGRSCRISDVSHSSSTSPSSCSSMPCRSAGGGQLAREERVGDARLEAEQRAARGLGGMRGEHRADVEPEHRLLDFGGAVPVALELAHRPLGGRRLWVGGLRGAVRARAPDAMHLLGGVDEQEEERERARGDRAQLERQRFDLVRADRRARARRVAVAPRAAGAAEGLDRVERLLALEAEDDAAERGGEPADVLVEGNVLTPDRGTRKRDGAHRGGGSGPARPRLAGLVRRVRQGAAPGARGRAEGGSFIL